jgi:hypothetical protein
VEDAAEDDEDAAEDEEEADRRPEPPPHPTTASAKITASTEGRGHSQEAGPSCTSRPGQSRDSDQTSSTQTILSALPRARDGAGTAPALSWSNRKLR